MVIKKKERNGKIEIDLTGPNGNAFALMGYGKDLAHQLSKDWSSIQAEMMSGDYENLVNVFEREFGDFVILYR